MLDYKRLLSDRGFLVYVTQAYPAMKPYLKEFHLSLETWQGNCDSEGWKLKAGVASQETDNEETPLSIKEIKLLTLSQGEGCKRVLQKGPLSEMTTAIPRFIHDLLALLLLSNLNHPIFWQVRSNTVVTAYYGFGDMSSGGFGLTV
jgi:hypothetical protein